MNIFRTKNVQIMAILKEMPREHIIAGFRGSLDFYYWLDKPIVRSWPRPPIGPRAPTVSVRFAPFGYINQVAHVLPEYLKQQYAQMAQGTGLSWKDYLVRAYMSGISYNPEE